MSNSATKHIKRPRTTDISFSARIMFNTGSSDLKDPIGEKIAVIDRFSNDLYNNPISVTLVKKGQLKILKPVLLSDFIAFQRGGRAER